MKNFHDPLSLDGTKRPTITERILKAVAQEPPSSGSERRLVRLRWDDPKWWPARCPRCGWEGMSNETEGGHQIADTGDYDDPVCPKCCHSDEGPFKGHWIPVEEIPEPNAIGMAAGAVVPPLKSD